MQNTFWQLIKIRTVRKYYNTNLHSCKISNRRL